MKATTAAAMLIGRKNGSEQQNKRRMRDGGKETPQQSSSSPGQATASRADGALDCQSAGRRRDERHDHQGREWYRQDYRSRHMFAEHQAIAREQYREKGQPCQHLTQTILSPPVKSLS